MSRLRSPSRIVAESWASARLFFYSLPMNTPRTKIINGDCQKVLSRLRDSCIDLVVTDPPYLVNYRSRDGRTIRNDQSSSWLQPAFTEIARVLKPNRFCVSFYGWNQAEKFLIAWKRGRTLSGRGTSSGRRPTHLLSDSRGPHTSRRIFSRRDVRSGLRG